MNPHDLVDAILALKRNLDPNHQAFVKSSLESASRTNNNDLDTFCQYSRYTGDEPQSSMEVSKGLKGLSSPSHDFYTMESEVEDPDGEPLEMDEEDPELKRKRRELRDINEQIMHKRAAIGLKKIGYVKETSPSGFSRNEQSVACKEPTLKDRVNAILLQQHPVSFLSQVQTPQDRMNSSSLRDHPLKLRVKALMKQRCSHRCVLQTNKEVPDVTAPPPRRSISSPAKEEKSVNQGFQRFLSVLNKGVDIDLLSRIVNDDSEDLPFGEDLLNIQPPAAENKPHLPLRSTSQQSNSGDSPLGQDQTNNGERKTDLPSQERSLIDHLPVNDEKTDLPSQERSLIDHLPVNDEKTDLPSQERSLIDHLPVKNEKRNDRRDLCFGSSCGSNSPPAVVKREEEEKTKVDEQRVQLENILKSLGLSLEVEEMSKLGNRTQERLYGKKCKGVRADTGGEGDSRRSDSHRQGSFSSSSSSYSSSSRLTSRSSSPSPSHSRDSKQRRLFEHSGSRDECRDTQSREDDNQNSKETQRHRDRGKDRKDSKETSINQHAYPQNQAYLHSHPAAVFPDSTSSQYSDYSAYNSGAYSAASNSYWTYTQGANPLSLHPSEDPYPQNSHQRFSGSVVAPYMVHHRHKTLEDINLRMNPDLSKSEGQIGSFSGPRCLQVITTKPTTQSYIMELTESLRRRENLKPLRRGRRLRKIRTVTETRSADSLAKMEAPQKDVNESHSKAKQSEEKKQHPTEEEIKANLRKTLEAFNQKVKQKLTQPSTSLTSQSVECREFL